MCSWQRSDYALSLCQSAAAGVIEGWLADEVLAARTLVRRWDEAMQAVARLEAEFDRFTRTRPRALDDAARGSVKAKRLTAGWGDA